MPIPRLQLFELEDLSWFPVTLRDYATDYLQFMGAFFRLDRPVLPLLRAALDAAKTPRIVDLCSGGGGPMLALFESLRAEDGDVHITLTDKFPSVESLTRLTSRHPGGIDFVSNSVDATRVPENLPGLRTMFNAFHHFNPEQARAVLACAVRQRQPICIFEVPERSLKAMAIFLFTPLFVAFTTPFMKPFRWDRLLWTYLIPLIPFTCWWDGMVSMGRAYTPGELLALTEGQKNYDWTVGYVSMHGGLVHVTHLLGVPRAS